MGLVESRPEPPYAAVLHGVRVGLITTCAGEPPEARGRFEAETRRLAHRLSAAAAVRADVEAGRPLDEALADAALARGDYEATLEGWSLILDDGTSVRVDLRLERDGSVSWRW